MGEKPDVAYRHIQLSYDYNDNVSLEMGLVVFVH